jgi:BirA family transcriptional regulator, biotin operon repressor / biotin---[acetyl-CoA-carboxylase] ligase
VGQQGLIGAAVAARLSDVCCASDQAPAGAPGEPPRGHASNLLWRVTSIAETTSTNDVCRDLARAGAPEGTVVIADVQTSGRGRLGRTWLSPSGSGLWCSVLLRPPLPLSSLGPLTLVIAVAAHRTLSAAGAAGVTIKWPNDLIWQSRKLAGILTEAAAPGGDGGGAGVGLLHEPPAYVVAGIGINLHVPPGGFPASLSGSAAALAQATGVAPDPGSLGASLLLQLARDYRRFLAEGFAGLRCEWLARSAMIGQMVKVTRPDGRSIAGVAQTIDQSGQLVLLLESGQTMAVAAADVTLQADRSS